MQRKDIILWGILFFIIFLLSQDYLFVRWEGKLGPLGLPLWITWFAFVHLLFIVVLYWFAKKHWR